MDEPEYIRLTDYLIELSHDFERLRAFWKAPDEILREEQRLREEHRNALLSGNLAEIQRLLSEENGGEEAVMIISPLRPINCPDP